MTRLFQMITAKESREYDPLSDDKNVIAFIEKFKKNDSVWYPTPSEISAWAWFSFNRKKYVNSLIEEELNSRESDVSDWQNLINQNDRLYMQFVKK